MPPGSITRLNQQQLEELYLRLEKPLYNVAFRWLWQKDDAQDVVQDAFVKLWRMRERVEMDRVQPLLYKITLNLASNRRRTKKLWRWISLDALQERRSSEGDSEKMLCETERRYCLRQAIDKLPERLKQVVMLCEFSGLSYRQVAEILSIPPGTVASRRNKALSTLKRKLGVLMLEESGNE